MKAYVLARKGVLISNPDIARMTTAQWLFEFHALQEKEKTSAAFTVEVYKESVTALRKLMIALLGLDVFGEKKIMPLALLAGNPKLLSKWYEDAQADEAIEAAANDTDFDQLSAQLAKGDIGDLDPTLFGDLSNISKDYTQTDDYKDALTALGIKIKP